MFGGGGQRQVDDHALQAHEAAVAGLLDGRVAQRTEHLRARGIGRPDGPSDLLAPLAGKGQAAVVLGVEHRTPTAEVRHTCGGLGGHDGDGSGVGVAVPGPCGVGGMHGGGVVRADGGRKPSLRQRGRARLAGHPLVDEGNGQLWTTIEQVERGHESGDTGPDNRHINRNLGSGCDMGRQGHPGQEWRTRCLPARVGS